MKIRLPFYVIIAILTVIQSWLLSMPNLLGKIGLTIYHYSYLKTFPKTLLSISIVVAVTIVLSEGIRFLVNRQYIKRRTGAAVLGVLILLCGLIFLKTIMDFSSGTYSHTGWRFRLGACLIPFLLTSVFIHALLILPKIGDPKEILPSEGQSSTETKKTDVDS